MAKKVTKKNTKAQVVENIKKEVVETVECKPDIESPVNEEVNAPVLMRWSFITTLNNIRFAEDLVMNNLTTTIYECDALTLDDAIADFVGQCKALFTKARTDEDIVNVLKVMFGKKIRVMHRPLNNDEYDYVDLT